MKSGGPGSQFGVSLGGAVSLGTFVTRGRSLSAGARCAGGCGNESPHAPPKRLATTAAIWNGLTPSQPTKSAGLSNLLFCHFEIEIFDHTDDDFDEAISTKPTSSFSCGLA